MNFYPIYKNKKLLPWIKWWLIKGNKVMPKHLSEWINSASAITITGVYKGSPLLNLNLNGNTSQTEVPSPEAPVPVNVVKGNNTIKINDTDYQVNLKSKNLIANNIETQEIYGVTITKGTDGSLLLNGTSNATIRLNLVENYNIEQGSYIWSIHKEGTISGTAFISLLTTGTTTELAGTAINLSTQDIKSFTISETTNVYARLYIGSNRTFTNFKIYPMLEEGSESTTYEPYYDYELCKIGDYQDVIYKENNKWYVDKYIGKIVLNGSESYSYSAGAKNTLLKNIGMISANIETTGYVKCNYYEEKGNASADSVDYAISRYGTTGTYNYQKLVFKNKDMTSASDFQTWLSTHNTTVYYVLSTSTTTEITETTLLSQLEAIYNAKLQSGTNEITQTPSDLPFYLNFQYYEKG